MEQLRCPVPVPAEGWTVEADLRSAHGARLSGDVLITSRVDPHRLGLVLVDVSGRGPVAGARAQRLTSAFRSLFDASLRSGSAFLPAANEQVLRETVRWGDDEGFATAIQVVLDLDSGEYTLTGAGHPPAVLYQCVPRQTSSSPVAARGRRPWRGRPWRAGAWRVLDDPGQGPALGLLGDAVFPSRPGRLGPGDALLLYTDGLVESRRLDVDRGIERLVRHAGNVLPHHRTGAAARIARAIRAEDGDDRALVVIRRDA